VHTLDENGHTEHHLRMDLNAGEQPQILIKAGVVFGSTVKVESTYALVSCVVAPGFDFRDFELCDPSSLLNLFPNHKEIINRLT
jgi:predicted cupin superfamily sugar epimerase